MPAVTKRMRRVRLIVGGLGVLGGLGVVGLAAGFVGLYAWRKKKFDQHVEALPRHEAIDTARFAVLEQRIALLEARLLTGAR